MKNKHPCALFLQYIGVWGGVVTVGGREEVDISITKTLPGESTATEVNGQNLAHLAKGVAQVRFGGFWVEITHVQ